MTSIELRYITIHVCFVHIGRRASCTIPPIPGSHGSQDAQNVTSVYRTCVVTSCFGVTCGTANKQTYVCVCVHFSNACTLQHNSSTCYIHTECTYTCTFPAHQKVRMRACTLLNACTPQQTLTHATYKQSTCIHVLSRYTKKFRNKIKTHVASKQRQRGRTSEKRRGLVRVGQDLDDELQTKSF